MSSFVSHAVRFRNRRRSRAQRQPHGRLALGCSTLLSLFLALLSLAALFGYTALVRNLPSLDTLPVLLDPPDGLLLHPTQIYDRSGQHVILTLETPAAAAHSYLPVSGDGSSARPEAVIGATLASLDPTFWENPGYTLDGWNTGAHPTLAQRLVSDLLLWDEPPSVLRNLRERLLAAQMVSRFGRARVLEWYLNSAHYGEWIYGADAAAQVYFGKPAAALSSAEAALLAAVAEAPGISPVDAPQMVRQRQQQVLQSMLLLGWLSVDEYLAADQEVLEYQPARPVENLAPAFTSLVLAQLQAEVPLDVLQRGGLRIVTTLDYALQLQVACATQVHLRLLRGQSPAETASDGSSCEAARLLPTLPGSAPLPELAASVVVFDPHTGQVLAMAGDPPDGLSALQPPGRSAGTLLSPFIYLTGFTRGLSPATLLWDLPAQGEAGQILEADYHGPVRLRTALANDYLPPAAQVLQQVGAENAWRIARQFGFESLPRPTAASSAAAASGDAPIAPSDDAITLLDGPITLLEGVQAYGVLANQGLLVGWPGLPGAIAGDSAALQPRLALRVEDVNGSLWLDSLEAQTRSIVTPQLAYLLTHILSDETARWPSLGHPNPLEIGRPAGAKLGRAANGFDTWAVGYTPQLVAGVWLGNASQTAQQPLQPELAAALWHAVIQYALRDLPTEAWSIPPGISQVVVCDPSGLLPTEDCPSVVNEVFLMGSEPTQADYLYQRMQVNRETGRLATVFTPPELVEARVYLHLPPQAAAWAQSAGLLVPPEDYDVLYEPPTLAEVQIAAPQMFAHVGGQVSFSGTASGADFAFYRLQVGQGLNPQAWVLVGQDVQSPVENGVLGVWDTSGLSGLFAVQLLVVRSDQRVETAVLQVTVDNQPPEVSILYPQAGIAPAYQPGSGLLLQAQASDNLELARLEFYIDDQLVATLSQPPYMVLWLPRLGEHTLRVQAVDLAGNTSQVQLIFNLAR